MDRKWSYLIFFLPLFFGLQAKAQNVLPFSDRDSGIEVFNILEDLALQLPPLDELLDMGEDFNPTIKREEALARAEEQRINVQKRLWTNHIRPFVILSQGNQGILVTGSADVFTNTVASGFLYGLNVSIPLYEFTTRGNRIKLATAEKEAALHMRDAMAIETRQEIAKAYYQLLAAQKTMVNHHEFSKSYHQ
ncbi:outer membrane efflux protein [Nitritalea halalkaliphila LW7]|uniref:Outer membrane efflux protein n=1 Tax=Nitritalea halalkaliphila LW7 TaxID=1189621 RepID=I5C1X6_9BACT|nr:TolC family protein [Nitritalea halalkaliphila]EIM75828.1 outer membrane efflux protein [Nitritalea halalkaliphila LW7]